MDEIVSKAREWDAAAIVVGLPLNMDGSHGEQARKALRCIAALRKSTGLPVIPWDERLSTVEAQSRLRTAGTKPSRNKGRLDSAAAAIILEAWLAERRGRADHPKSSCSLSHPAE